MDMDRYVVARLVAVWAAELVASVWALAYGRWALTAAVVVDNMPLG